MALTLQDCLVDLEKRTVIRDGQTKRLTGTESALLQYLTGRPHDVITREEFETWAEGSRLML